MSRTIFKNSSARGAPLRLIRGQPASAAVAAWGPSVITIGTFDGLHIGHRALIGRALERAAQLGAAAALLSFEPMPREFLHAQDPPARLTSFRERWRLLDGCGLERLHLLAFNDRLRALSGPEFMELLRRFGARVVVVGHDFRFGREGGATADWFARESHHYGFQVEVVAPVLVDGARASSGLVRAALAAGDLPAAARLLGRPYTMCARVRRGAQLGRTIGYPTANLALHRRRAPLGGIFAVRVRGDVLGMPPGPGPGWPAVASLGTRPTVNGVEPLLEVHLFEFNADLYGAELEIEFVSQLRPERRFDSLDAMVEQMHRDAAEARAVLSLLV